MISTKEKEFKPYFDVNKHSDMVIARVYQEERNGVSEPELRMVHAENYFERRIEKDDWEYNRHSGVEKEATKNAFELMKDGYNLVVWLSPVSDIYEEGRINIMLPGIENGEIFFDPWGMPLLLNKEESIKLGENLLEAGGMSIDPIIDVESLRRQPIGYMLETDEEWLNKCQELIPEMEWAWKAIREGKVDKNMKDIALRVMEAKERANGDNIVFEKIMANMGLKLNVAGDHGGSWLSTEMGNGVGVIIVVTPGGISYRIGSTEGLTLCKKCGCWYSGEKCPICK